MNYDDPYVKEILRRNRIVSSLGFLVDNSEETIQRRADFRREVRERLRTSAYYVVVKEPKEDEQMGLKDQLANMRDIQAKDISEKFAEQEKPKLLQAAAEGYSAKSYRWTDLDPEYRRMDLEHLSQCLDGVEVTTQKRPISKMFDNVTNKYLVIKW